MKQPSQSSAIALFLVSLLLWLATVKNNTLGFIAPTNAEAIGFNIWSVLMWSLFMYSIVRLYWAVRSGNTFSKPSTSREDAPITPQIQTAPQMQLGIEMRAETALVGVGGWLLLLIIKLWVSTAVRALSGLGDGYSLLLVFGLFSAALSGVSAYMLGRGRLKGVLLAKIFLWFDVAYYVLRLLDSLYGEKVQTSDPFPAWYRPSGYLVASLLWLLYLARSQRVRNTYYPATVETLAEDSLSTDSAIS